MYVYKAELRSIDAWCTGDEGRTWDADVGWTWNESFHECDVTFNEGQTDDATLIQWLIDNGYLLPMARDRVEVYHDGGGLYEIQDKETGEPILAFIGDWENRDE